MCTDINIGNFQYSQNEKGEWIYKSIDKVKKKIKPEYKDKAQYKVIEQYESKVVDQYNNMLNESLKEVNKLLKDMQ